MKFTANQLMGCFQTPLKLINVVLIANLYVLVRSTFKKLTDINHAMFVLYIPVFLLLNPSYSFFWNKLSKTDLMSDFHYF